MSIEIRQLTAADAEVFHALRMRALREHPEVFLIAADEEAGVDGQRERLAEAERRDDDFIFGAFDGANAVGIVGVLRATPNRAKGRHRALIWSVYVTPEARRQGVGRRLVESAIDVARGIEGIEQIQIGVLPGSAARRLYASLGFETWGVDRNTVRLDGRHYDDEMMVLFL